MHRINDIKYALDARRASSPAGWRSIIVLQPDLGTPAMLVLAVVAMIFSAGLSWRYLAGVAMLMLPVLGVLHRAGAIPRGAHPRVPESGERACSARTTS